VSAARPAVGGSRELYLVDVETPDGAVVPLVLRCEAGGSFTGTEISPAKEAVVYRALEHTAVPVPRVVGMAPGNAALLMERVPGTTDMSQLDATQQARAMEHFIDALVRLHNLDVADLELPGFALPRTPEEHARLDLDAWTRLGDEYVVHLDPLVRFAGAWLRAHPPTSVDRTVLVHGDAGPGNFLVDGDEVTGIVDWEFAHLGDPMDDWAWIDMRAGGDDLSELQDRYRAATGIAIDHDRVRYWRVAVDYRCAITTSMAASRGGGARGLAPYLLVTERYVVGLADRLGALLGVTEVPELPAPANTARTSHYDLLLDGIRSAVRAIDDPEAREATRNLQILVHYLRAYDELGHQLEAMDRDDRAATFGAAGDDEAELRGVLEEAGRDGDEVVLRYLLRRTRREQTLWATLLDRPRR
jgi:aminoglycoside phosphotransferase (APT) family kinase protein